MRGTAIFTTTIFAASCSALSQTPTKLVRNTAELQAAVKAAQPGTRIEIAPGDYAGGLVFTDLRGDVGKPIVLAGADPAKPPRFTGGANGLHLANPFHVELHNLYFTGATANGVSIDDGGRYVGTPRGIVLRRLHIADVGPRGNHDAIKLSGPLGAAHFAGDKRAGLRPVATRQVHR